MRIAFIYCILIILFTNCQSNEYSYADYDEYYREYYTEMYSTTVMGSVKLYKLEQEFMQILKKSTIELQKQINMIQIYLKYFKRPKCSNQNECKKYVAKPLNAFRLMRRIHQDWPQWLKLIKSGNEADYIKQLENEIVPKLPESHDMLEMLKNLHRVETTYGIRVHDYANGKMPKTQSNWTLTVRDCVTMGNYGYQIHDYQRAGMWYQYALNQRPEVNGESYKQMLGDPLDHARLKYAQTILIHEVHRNEPALAMQEIRDEVEQVLSEVDAKSINDLVNDRLHQSVTEFELNDNQTTVYNRYKHRWAHMSGCRGMFRQHTNLVCRYNFTTSPFLQLAPMKLEEISLDPYIVQYHDVLSDNEIEDLKREGIKGTMINGWTSLKSSNATENESRTIVARVAIMSPSLEIVQRINRRIIDMTGFNIEESKTIQLAAFSVGGFFMPHYDYLYDRLLDTDVLKKLGDRVASVIFYAGDVTEGGATNFPRNQLVVQPKKGSALFWYNKFDDGSPDPRSLHSICPVVVGSRWTITKWIHQDSQMFLQPCSLQPSSST
ncbi:prolyl 4-hydroxylase subunit alpha-2 [Drosophila willistoni]|uniref:prolyl 4-hydroxylase subunit alpha-2 n=1 Tax=Drosophila willistoni TaxID=7260 RepID=UPI001F07BDA1|nr:prolyl 4-hydroxylase subunit alpha-2 [Drosophila willistoni]